MNKKILLIYAFFLLIFSYFALAQVINPQCCITDTSCYQDINMCAEAEFSGDFTATPVFNPGLSSLSCTQIKECDMGCYNMTSSKLAIYRLDTPDRYFQYISPYGDVLPTAFCEGSLPACDNSCSAAPCLCGSDTKIQGKYCNASKNIVNTYSDCLSSYNQYRYTYEIEFEIKDKKNNALLQDAVVRINSIILNSSSVPSNLGRTQATDTLGKTKFTLLFNQPLRSINYDVTKSGYQIVNDDFTGFISGKFTYLIKINLSSMSICIPPQTKEFTSNGCVFYQECIEDSNGNYIWSSAIKKKDPNCELTEKEFCDDNKLDYYLNEECISGCVLGDPNCCAVGEYCDNCICKKASEGCVIDGVVANNELCDPLKYNRIETEDKRAAFNPHFVDYILGMECTEKCLVIMPSNCGNNQYEFGEECEFYDETEILIDIDRGLPMCGFDDCIKPKDDQGNTNPLGCTCRINAFCGNTKLDGTEECDWGTSKDATSGAGSCISSKCNSPLGDCTCEKPSCPNENDIKLGIKKDINTLNLTINITPCLNAPLTNITLIYYEADQANKPLDELNYKELPIPSSYYSDTSINLKFKRDDFSFIYNSQAQNIGDLYFKNSSKFCFSVHSRYDTSAYPFTNEDYYSNDVVCINFGDYLCNFYPNQEFCFNNHEMKCKPNNILDDRGSCGTDKCVVINGKTDCLSGQDDSKCKRECGGLFSMFSFDDNIFKVDVLLDVINFNCINDLFTTKTFLGYCYLDHSSTPVDEFNSCTDVNTCYDYNSEYACELDACFASALNCTWNPLPHAGLGEGVCAPADPIEQDCNICNQNDMNNKLLSYCSQDICPKYGNNCYYRDDINIPNPIGNAVLFLFDISPDGCSHKKDLGCEFLSTQEECIGKNPKTNSSLNKFNMLTRSNDAIGIGTCKWKNSPDYYKGGYCFKDADDNKRVDCESFWNDEINLTKCITDNIPPVTIIDIKSEMNGNFNISVSRNDNAYSSDELITYWMILPIGQTSTFDKKNMESDEKIDYYEWTGEGILNDTLILDYNEKPKGNYIFYYYSGDPAKNVEEIHQVPFYLDTEKPNITVDVKIFPFIDSSYSNEEIEFFAMLNITTDIKDNNVKRINCSLKLYNIDGPTAQEIYPSLMSINDRGYNYAPNNSQIIHQNYPMIEAGEYLFNTTCIDFVGNRADLQTFITVKDTLITNIQPNNTRRYFPSVVSFDTLYDASCYITDFSGKDYNFHTLPANLRLPEEGFNKANPTKHHYLNWEDVIDMFGDYPDDESLVTGKYFIKCLFNEPNEDIVNATVGNKGHYIKFAIDKDPPFILYFNRKPSGNGYMEINTSRWLYRPNMTIFSMDESLKDIYGKSWESGTNNLTVRINYKDQFDDTYLYKSYFNYVSCNNPLRTYEDRRQVCSNGLNYLAALTLSGYYRFDIVTYDKVGNMFPTSFELKIDNQNYTFRMYLDDEQNGMLQRKLYQMRIIPSKNITYLRETLDPQYNMTLIHLQVYKTQGATRTYLKTLDARLNENTGVFMGALDMRDFEFAGLNSDDLVFSIRAFDSHGILMDQDIEGFIADTTPPSKLILSTLFTDKEEVQYTDVNGKDYPLFYYGENYYTNQDSLFVTGSSDRDAKVIFSWNDKYADNGSYDISSNIDSHAVSEIAIHPDYPVTFGDSNIYLNFTANSSRGKYVSFISPDVFRNTYGNYGKRFKVIDEYADTTYGEYKRAMLEEPIDIKNIRSAKIKVYDAPFEPDTFIFNLSIPQGCNVLYIRAVDENQNIRLAGSYNVCKDKNPPWVDINTLTPRPDSYNSNPDKNISIFVSDIIPQSPYGLIKDKASKYGPKLFKNNTPLANYFIESPSDSSYFKLRYETHGVQGEFNMTVLAYDYAHNLFNFSWSFIIDNNLPENPTLDFDKGLVRVSPQKDVYFFNDLPSKMHLNFTKKENKTINYVKIEGTDLLQGDPREEVYDSLSLDIDPLVDLHMNEDYEVLIDIIKYSVDLGNIPLPKPYKSLLVFDDLPPIVTLADESVSLIGTDYIGKQFFEIWFNFSGEDYPPSEARIYFEDRNPSMVQVDVNTCKFIDEKLYQCMYPLDLSKVYDGTILKYYISADDMSGNTGNSKNYILNVDREIPEFLFRLNSTENVIEISDGVSKYDYLVYPYYYSFNAESSKDLNSSEMEVGFMITDSKGTIHHGPLSSEDIIIHDNKTFSFIFNSSKYPNKLNPLNDIVGEINFYFAGKDLSGNSFEDIIMGYDSRSLLWFHSKNSERPILEPILKYPDSKIDEGVQFTDAFGEEYPLYYYDSVFYTKEDNTLYITGFADDIGHNISIIRTDRNEVLDSYITSRTTPLTYNGKVNKVYPGGKKGDDFLVLESNYDINVRSEYVCVFFENHFRKDFGDYKKGYHIIDTQSVDGYRKLILEDPLENDVHDTKITFHLGEECKNSNNYFELKINLSEVGEENIPLKIKDLDQFKQLNFYPIGELRKDTNPPRILSKRPTNEEIVADPYLNISFTICDNSPGILGSKSPTTFYNKGQMSDFYVEMNDEKIIQGYVSPVYVKDNLFCYNFTQKNNFGYSVGRHKMRIHSMDFAHNTYDEIFYFIVDPLSPQLKSFALSESSGLIFTHKPGMTAYDILFTRNNTPEILINFYDMDRVDFQDVKLYYIDNQNTMIPLIIFGNDYEILNDPLQKDFGCRRELDKGNNFFNCSISTTLSLNKIYMLEFQVNKTIEIGGEIKNVNSNKFRKYFVFDNVLRVTEDIYYQNPTQSKKINFKVESEEMFGVLLRLMLKDKYGRPQYFNLTGTQNKEVSIWNIDMYSGQFTDSEGATLFPSGNYSYTLHIMDHAGNFYDDKNWVIIDDESPEIRLTSFKAIRFQVEPLEKEEEDTAFNKKVRFKAPEIVIEGVVEADSSRRFVDVSGINFMLSKRDGQKKVYFDIGICEDSSCDYRKKISNDLAGCICRSNGVFNITLSNDLIPFEPDKVIDINLEITPRDDAFNEKTYKAFMMRDFEPPKRPKFEGLEKVN